jgi:TolA-binding protein
MSDDLDPFEDRVLRAAARGFELESSVEIDDDARIERLARQFEKRGRRAARSHARSFALGLAAALLLVGTVVAAIQLTVGLSSSSAPASPVSSTPRGEPAAPSTDLPAAPVLTAVPPEPSSAIVLVPQKVQPPAVKREAPSRPLEDAVAPVGSLVESPPEPPPPSASELFSAGNKARSRGDAPSALGFYARLQSEYPAAPESLAARISIGMLELQRGRATVALGQFRAYRQANARSLRAEALWGEAEALRALGRSAEERAVLESLLSEYPTSAYAPAARKRLGRD